MATAIVSGEISRPQTGEKKEKQTESREMVGNAGGAEVEERCFLLPSSHTTAASSREFETSPMPCVFVPDSLAGLTLGRAEANGGVGYHSIIAGMSYTDRTTIRLHHLQLFVLATIA